MSIEEKWTKRYREAAEPIKPEDLTKIVEEHKDDQLFLKAVKKYAQKARGEA